jgi:hypothetical protein
MLNFISKKNNVSSGIEFVVFSTEEDRTKYQDILRDYWTYVGSSDDKFWKLREGNTHLFEQTGLSSYRSSDKDYEDMNNLRFKPWNKKIARLIRKTISYRNISKLLDK